MKTILNISTVFTIFLFGLFFFSPTNVMAVTCHEELISGQWKIVGDDGIFTDTTGRYGEVGTRYNCSCKMFFNQQMPPNGYPPNSVFDTILKGARDGNFGGHNIGIYEDGVNHGALILNKEKEDGFSYYRIVPEHPISSGAAGSTHVIIARTTDDPKTTGFRCGDPELSHGQWEYRFTTGSSPAQTTPATDFLMYPYSTNATQYYAFDKVVSFQGPSTPSGCGNPDRNNMLFSGSGYNGTAYCYWTCDGCPWVIAQDNITPMGGTKTHWAAQLFKPSSALGGSVSSIPKFQVTRVVFSEIMIGKDNPSGPNNSGGNVKVSVYKVVSGNPRGQLLCSADGTVPAGGETTSFSINIPNCLSVDSSSILNMEIRQTNYLDADHVLGIPLHNVWSTSSNPPSLEGTLDYTGGLRGAISGGVRYYWGSAYAGNIDSSGNLLSENGLPGATYNDSWREDSWLSHVEIYGKVADDAQCVSMGISGVAPSSDGKYHLKAGQSYTLNVAMKNIGGTTWHSDAVDPVTPYHVGSVNDNTDFTIARGALPSQYINPGSTATFNLPGFTPKSTLSGDKTVNWRMLHEYVAWFGEVCSLPVYVENVPNCSDITRINVPPPDPTNPNPNPYFLEIGKPATFQANFSNSAGNFFGGFTAGVGITSIWNSSPFWITIPSITGTISSTWTPAESQRGGWIVYCRASNNLRECRGNPAAVPVGSTTISFCNGPASMVPVTVGYPPPTLNEMTIDADPRTHATPIPWQGSGLRSSEGGSDSNNGIKIVQTLTNANDYNYDLVGLYFEESPVASGYIFPNTPAPLSNILSSLGTNGFMIVYANCSGNASCTEAGKTFLRGNYYIYFQGWNGPYPVGRKFVGPNSEIEITINSGSFSGPFDYTVILHKIFGSHNWGTLQYLKWGGGSIIKPFNI